MAKKLGKPALKAGRKKNQSPVSETRIEIETKAEAGRQMGTTQPSQSEMETHECDLPQRNETQSELSPIQQTIVRNSEKRKTGKVTKSDVLETEAPGRLAELDKSGDQLVTAQETSSSSPLDVAQPRNLRHIDTDVLVIQPKTPTCMPLQPDPALFRIANEYDEGVRRLHEELAGYRRKVAKEFEEMLNMYLEKQDPQTFEEKHRLAEKVSQDLDKLGLAIISKGMPCRFFAQQDYRHLAGRFSLLPIGGSRGTTENRRDLSTLLPFEVMVVPSRREGFKEWRQRTRKNGGATTEFGSR